MIVAAAGYTASFPVAAAPSAGEPPSTTVPRDADERMIPRPNSGEEPTEAGDRGGALQLAVFGGIVVGVALILTLVVRESRRNLARRAVD